MPCRYYRDICCCPLPLKSVLLLHWQWSWSGRPWVASLDKFLREVCGRSSQLAAAAAAPAQRGRGGPQSRRGEERSEEWGVQQKILGPGLDMDWAGCWLCGRVANIEHQTAEESWNKYTKTLKFVEYYSKDLPAAISLATSLPRLFLPL